MIKGKVTLIAGPTASGKSALAFELARQRRGTIINADAMQVYAGLPILTAQPSPEEKEEIPHELYAVFEPGIPSSAGKWHALALEAIERAHAEGRHPILVGGTGLYFRTLKGGLADIPPVPSDTRIIAQDLYETMGEAAFRANLAQQDPISATDIKPHDRQRLIRAYEVVLHTGTALSAWHKKERREWILDPLLCESHLLMPPREDLYAACDRRFLKMIEYGALLETEHFILRHLDKDLPAMKTLGLRELASHLDGNLSLDAAVDLAQRATRNYAKRQMTWFRHQWKDDASDDRADLT